MCRISDYSGGSKTVPVGSRREKLKLSADHIVMSKLSIVIPCFNEAATIERLLDAVHAAPIADKEIIVVNDGSSDGTTELLDGKLRARIHVLIHLAENS